MKFIITILISIALIFGNSEESKFHYIDIIDEIKSLERLSENYLHIGDTLSAIDVLIEITDYADISDIYGDKYISDQLYKIGDLYLLINEPILAEEYLLKSVDSYNKTMVKNQLLMKDPLSSLALIYNNFNDTIRLNATLNKVDRIIDLQNEDLSDSIQYDLITFEDFDDNIQEESENFIYNQIDLAMINFNQNLFTQAVESLNNSLSMTSNEIGFNYYSDLEIFDDSNLEYLLPAFMSQIQFDSLDIKSNFFTSMIHLKLSNYDQALAMGFNYHDDNPDDFKVYELIIRS